jgi:hypothetical protein
MDIEKHVRRLTEADGSVAWRAKDPRGDSVVLRDPDGDGFPVA